MNVSTNVPMNVHMNIPLAPLTTFRVGGPAQYFADVRTREELTQAIAFAKENRLTVTILGGGSNVLVADEGIRGLVVKNSIEGISYAESGEDVAVTAGAGVVWDELVAETVARGLWGLENLSAIPGSVGATPVQNVGAYGVEVAGIIAHVDVYDMEAHAYTRLQPRECQFAYRDSMFKHDLGRRYIIVAVTYALSSAARPQLGYKDLADRFAGSTPSLSEIRDAVVAIRSGKFPDLARTGTAGSFFKNPVISREQFAQLCARYPGLPGYEESQGIKVPLGWILDNVLHLRGVRKGDVGTHERQALVIVNHGNATASEIDAFARSIEEKVFDATGVSIEREVRMLS